MSFQPPAILNNLSVSVRPHSSLSLTLFLCLTDSSLWLPHPLSNTLKIFPHLWKLFPPALYNLLLRAVGSFFFSFRAQCVAPSGVGGFITFKGDHSENHTWTPPPLFLLLSQTYRVQPWTRWATCPRCWRSSTGRIRCWIRSRTAALVWCR